MHFSVFSNGNLSFDVISKTVLLIFLYSFMRLKNIEIKILLTFLITFPIHVLNAQWAQKASFPWQEFTDGSAFSIGSTIYLLPGANPVNGNSFWAYNTLTNVWSQRAAFPGNVREGGISFSAGGKGYFGMGATLTATIPQTAVFFNDLWEYDPAINNWAQKASLPAPGRNNAVAFELNGRGYVGTGFGLTGGYLADFWEYDPATNSWVQKAFFPGPPRTMASGTGFNGNGFVGMGANYNQSTVYSDFYMYLPSTNTWSTLTSFNGGGIYSARLVVAGNALYLTGGFITSPSSNISVFDPLSNSWTTQSPFPGGFRTNHIAISVGNKMFMGMGADQGNFYQKDWWEFNPLGLSVNEDKEAIEKVPFISPNPSAKDSRVFCHTCNGKTVTFTDLNGRLIHSLDLKSDGTDAHFLPQLSPGIYIVNFKGGATNTFQKLVITE